MRLLINWSVAIALQQPWYILTDNDLTDHNLTDHDLADLDCTRILGRKQGSSVGVLMARPWKRFTGKSDCVVEEEGDWSVADPPPDILALKHISRIFGHCNTPALLVSNFQASIWALNGRRCHTHKPDRKAVLGCCNVREFYWSALERGYLFSSSSSSLRSIHHSRFDRRRHGMVSGPGYVCPKILILFFTSVENLDERGLPHNFGIFWPPQPSVRKICVPDYC